MNMTDLPWVEKVIGRSKIIGRGDRSEHQDQLSPDIPSTPFIVSARGAAARICGQRRRGGSGRIEFDDDLADDLADDNAWDSRCLDVQVGDDPDIRPGTTDRPEQVRFVYAIDVFDRSVRQHDCGGLDVVEGQVEQQLQRCRHSPRFSRVPPDHAAQPTWRITHQRKW